LSGATISNGIHHKALLNVLKRYLIIYRGRSIAGST